MTRATHQFSQTKTAEIPRSSFDLSHGLKTTFDSGLIVPILSLEVLPGDTINLRASLFGRLATPIKPVLDSLYLETFFFFTPWRQVWPDFVKMMGEQENPGDSIDFSVPTLAGATPIAEQDPADYLGIPIGAIPDSVTISALPFRAINAIFNYWFRDENLIDSLLVPKDAGPDDVATNGYDTLNRRRKRRDYITSNLPFPQKGAASTVPLGGLAPLIGLASGTNQVTSVIGAGRAAGGVDTNYLAGWKSEFGTINQEWKMEEDPANPGYPNLYVDLSAASGFSINDLRESFQIQKLLERDARGGTRYPEILMSHFRVNDPQLLVHQRPLFLGGGSSRVNITPVQQMNATSSDVQQQITPQGNLAGFGTVSGSNHGFTSSFTEHGIILGFVNVRADLTYQQGLERYWQRQTRYDFYWPALSHLGEQPTKNSEVFLSNNVLIDDETFGYMPRYDEYRFKQSQITGLFRSDATASLDVWHLAQDFTTLPVLNQAFIEDNPPIDRVVAVPTEPDFLLDLYFKIKAARPLPLYATPGLIDHF